jgi:hypothetical protein
MRRWGNVEGHTYIGGVFDNAGQAKEAAKAESQQRGGKYDYQIFLCRHHSIMKVFTNCHQDKINQGQIDATQKLSDGEA